MKASALFQRLLTASVILREDWESLPAERRQGIKDSEDPLLLIELLVREGLLTDYQASRVSIGKTYGLVLGNYRVLERVGAGAMGVVYKGEHVRMRRPVAIKVLTLNSDENENSELLTRFFAEMRAVARLQHPNIVNAIDAGEVHSANPDVPMLHYYVMEYVPGNNLEEYILERGPLEPERACDLICQVAAALCEAHKHGLVHRDIKPANILVTPEYQTKLLDFGLARHFGKRLTEPGMVVGTVDYMAPEQVRNSSDVDIRADIYSLGGTLFWCLAGRQPFLSEQSIERDLIARLYQEAPSIRAVRPDIPEELEQIVRRMMATEPGDRYPTPQGVVDALIDFLRTEKHGGPPSPPDAGPLPAAAQEAQRVLVVDDEPEIRNLCRYAMQAGDIAFSEAANGTEAMVLLRETPFDLLLLDVDMPGMGGAAVLRHLRRNPPTPHLKIIMISGRASADEMAQMLHAGADDYLTKPFSLVQLQARVRAALRLKTAQDQSGAIRAGTVLGGPAAADQPARPSDAVLTQNVLLLLLNKLLEQRQVESAAHSRRLQLYCTSLAEDAAPLPAFAGVIDQGFTQMLRGCVPFHDIGMLALPDHLLQEQGKLTAQDRIFMQAHTTLGAEVLQEAGRRYDSQLGFLRMAIEIARHHQERFDGSGYPDGLAGNTIPLSARLVTLADVYDALRSRRPYKPALAHGAALHLITQESLGQFDPALLSVLPRCATRWETIFREEQG